jgi:hypothetical protein
MQKIKIKFLFQALILSVIAVTGCNTVPEKGVSLKLASDRKMLLKNIVYSLNFVIPSGRFNHR